MGGIETMLSKNLVRLSIFLSKRIFIDAMMGQELGDLHYVFFSFSVIPREIWPADLKQQSFPTHQFLRDLHHSIDDPTPGSSWLDHNGADHSKTSSRGRDWHAHELHGPFEN